MLTIYSSRRNHAKRVRLHVPARVLRCQQHHERFLHNALGQRVFKSEPQVDHVAPNATVLGSSFVSWLLANFNWMFATAQANATLGQSFVYAEPAVGMAALLGEYGNGGVSSTGRREYLWLPVADTSGDAQANAIPIGLYRDAALFAIHSDHLATPRRVADARNLAVWQWPYSPFGDQAPTGVLAPAGTATAVFAIDPASQTNTATRLVTSTPTALNLRFPGQYFDTETGLSYNYFRSYQPTQGRYPQPDPIGLDGGWNRFAYVDSNPLADVDPLGLQSNKINRFDSIPLGHGGGGAGGMPNFAVSPGGTVFPIPGGARGPLPVVNPGGKVTGSAFTGGGGGSNGQVCTVRFMDSTPARGSSPGYPNGYVKYENASGQGVDPYSGKTLPNSQSHFPR